MFKYSNKISSSRTLFIGTTYASLFLSSCSIGVSGKTNFGFAQTEGQIIAYSGEPVIPSPVYKTFKLNSKAFGAKDFSELEPYTDLSDTVKLAAYTDSKCKTAATGKLAAESNPVPLDAGIATFSDVTFTTTDGKESNIYLGSTLVSNNLTYCSTLPMNILQHFNLGKGCLSFGLPGAAGANTAASISDIARIHRVDSSGRYVIAGTSKNAGGGQEMAIWRYLPNGTIDISFGGGTGYIHSGTTGLAGATGASELETVTDLQIDKAGNYFILGSSVNASAGTEIALWKYDSTGALATSFATGGKYHTGSPGLTGRTPLSAVNDSPKALRLDSDGKIVVVGTSRNAGNGYELFVARFTTAGVLDSTFGTFGVYHPGSPGAAGAANAAENDIGYAIQADSKGAYLIAGSSAYSGGGTELALWKLSSTGQSLDTSFGAAGIRLFGTLGAAGGTGGNLADVGKSLQIDPLENWVIAGSSKNSMGGTEMAIWKYTSNGTLDPTFGTAGYIHSGTTGAAGATGASTMDIGASLAIDTANKKYLITGPSTNASAGIQGAIWKYSETGTPDSNFNSTGVVTTSDSGVAGNMTAVTVNDSSASIQVDSVGTYTIVGSTKNSAGGKEMSIWRYLLTGTINL